MSPVQLDSKWYLNKLVGDVVHSLLTIGIWNHTRSWSDSDDPFHRYCHLKFPRWWQVESQFWTRFNLKKVHSICCLRKPYPSIKYKVNRNRDVAMCNFQDGRLLWRHYWRHKVWIHYLWGALRHSAKENGCAKMSAYSVQNCQRRSILKM